MSSASLNTLNLPTPVGPMTSTVIMRFDPLAQFVVWSSSIKNGLQLLEGLLTAGRIAEMFPEKKTNGRDASDKTVELAVAYAKEPKGTRGKFWHGHRYQAKIENEVVEVPTRKSFFEPCFVTKQQVMVVGSQRFTGEAAPKLLKMWMHGIARSWPNVPCA